MMSAVKNELCEPNAIDEVLRTYPWLDCELHMLRRRVLAVLGGVALARGDFIAPDVVLYFYDLFFVSAPRRWTSDTDRNVFKAHGDTQPAGAPFRTDIGYSLFEFHPEDLGTSCWIAARSVRMVQVRLPEEPLTLPMNWAGGGGWLPHERTGK